MTTNQAARPDARHCPQCGARGILPLDQPQGDRGEIVDPVMICPKCKQEFRAEGTTWLGAVDVANISDEEIDKAAESIATRFEEQMTRHERSRTEADLSDPGELLDVDGGPDNNSGDLFPTDDMIAEEEFWDSVDETGDNETESQQH